MNFKMQLNQEEIEILEGKQGETLQKILKALVTYGDIFQAERLVNVTGASHMAISYDMPAFEGLNDILDELIKNDIKTKIPFTVNPKPYDFENVKMTGGQKGAFKKIYGKQKFFEEKLLKIGLRDNNSFACTCYLEQVKNIPAKGSILSWSGPESVIYANSVLGARTNLNPAIIGLFGAVLGKVPEYGLLTDEGRKAGLNVVLNTRHLPNVELLGHAIALKAKGEIPYIQGIDQFLGRRIDEPMQDYLKDLGAVISTSGLGLFHIDHVTPDAVQHGKKLLKENAEVYIIDDEELSGLQLTYPMPWKSGKMKPKMAVIGCPHLTVNQVEKWTVLIERALKMHGKVKVAIPTYLCVDPDVFTRFKANYTMYNKLMDTGVQFSFMCPKMLMSNPKWSNQPVVTNSNVLRIKSNARYYDDQELSGVIATGRCK